jgi:hypothetical protein
LNDDAPARSPSLVHARTDADLDEAGVTDVRLRLDQPTATGVSGFFPPPSALHRETKKPGPPAFHYVPALATPMRRRNGASQGALPIAPGPSTAIEAAMGAARATERN